MQLTITGYSTALFSTWYFVEELGILFDCGDGVSAALLQKARKVEHVFISHADRDHLAGLLQFNQLNARHGYPVMYYPRHSASFPALEAFSKKFDPHVASTLWHPASPGTEIFLRDDLLVQPLRNGHVPVDASVIRSLSYKVIQTKRKLKPALEGLSGLEIKQYAEQYGKESTTDEVRTNVLTYSGDTPVEDPSRWDGSEILIHEATFLGGGEHIKSKPHVNKHSTLEAVMEMVASIRIGKLVLGHFSSRYDSDTIDRAILSYCDKYAINIPVYRVLPGVTVTDILSRPALNA